MPILADKENFQCDLCYGIFPLIRDDTWNEKEIEAEFNRTFPGYASSPKKDRAIVCDDCFKLIRPH